MTNNASRPFVLREIYNLQNSEVDTHLHIYTPQHLDDTANPEEILISVSSDDGGGYFLNEIILPRGVAYSDGLGQTRVTYKLKRAPEDTSYISENLPFNIRLEKQNSGKNISAILTYQWSDNSSISREFIPSVFS